MKCVGGLSVESPTAEGDLTLKLHTYPPWAISDSVTKLNGVVRKQCCQDLRG